MGGFFLLLGWFPAGEGDLLGTLRPARPCQAMVHHADDAVLYLKVRSCSHMTSASFILSARHNSVSIGRKWLDASVSTTPLHIPFLPL